MERDDKKNLIVNYLPNTLSQDEVKKIFERVGKLASCKLIRNKLNGQSLGYAFVEYIEEADAASAISEITGLEMGGKRIKVSYARNSSSGGGGSGGGTSGGGGENCNVYVANLPESVTEDRLLELFSDYGSITSHKLLTNPDGTSRGAGFVRFSNSVEAGSAIKALAGERLPDSTNALTVKLAIPPASKTAQSLNAITSSTLGGVGIASRTSNLRYNPLGAYPQAIVNPQLNIAASPVAAALSGMPAHIAQHGSNVVAATQQVAQQVTQNPYSQLTANAQVTQAVTAMASVYVFGLQPTHTELTLYELFSPFGAILNVKLMRDYTKEDKPGKGFGFVNFTKMDDALRAIASMNGVPFEDKILQVSLKQNKTQTIPQTIYASPQPQQVYTGYGNGSIS